MQTLTSRQLILFWLPPLLFSTAILACSGDLGSYRHTLQLVKWLLSWLPFFQPDEMASTNSYLRKAGHMLAYACLYFLWFRAFRRHFATRFLPAVVWSLGLCLLISLLDEGHQSFYPSRGSSLKDVALDFFASSVTAIALWFKRE